MIYEGFKVYRKPGELLEELPAILYLEEEKVIAQVPEGVTSVSFLNGETDEVIETAPVVNRRAELQFTGSAVVRVGQITHTRLNQVHVNPPEPPKPRSELDDLKEENALLAFELINTQLDLAETKQQQADLILFLVETGVI